MKLVFVLGVVVGVLLVQAHAVPEADAVDQSVGLQDVNAGGQNDAVESPDDAHIRRKRCIWASECKNHPCPGHSKPICTDNLKCLCA